MKIISQIEKEFESSETYYINLVTSNCKNIQIGSKIKVDGRTFYTISNYREFYTNNKYGFLAITEVDPREFSLISIREVLTDGREPQKYLCELDKISSEIDSACNKTNLYKNQNLSKEIEIVDAEYGNNINIWGGNDE